MKPFQLLLAASLALVSTAWADDKSPPAIEKNAPAKSAEELPSVDQVLERHLRAAGGKAAFEKLTSRTVKATIEVPALNANIAGEIIAKAPDRKLTVLDIPGFGAVKEGYNGKVGWTQNPQAGVSEKTGEELALFKREALFNRELKLKEIYAKLVLKGKMKVADRDAFVLEASLPSGDSDRFYFDAQTGLLFRHDSEFFSPAGKLRQEIYFEDHQEVDGVKLPFTIRRVSPPQFAFTTKITEVKHNVAVDDARFEKPAAQ